MQTGSDTRRFRIFPGKDYPDRAPFMAETGMKTAGLPPA